MAGGDATGSMPTASVPGSTEKPFDQTRQDTVARSFTTNVSNPSVAAARTGQQIAAWGDSWGKAVGSGATEPAAQPSIPDWVPANADTAAQMAALRQRTAQAAFTSSSDALGPLTLNTTVDATPPSTPPTQVLQPPLLVNNEQAHSLKAETGVFNLTGNDVGMTAPLLAQLRSEFREIGETLQQQVAELRQNLTELQKAFPTADVSRLAIGGNHPPVSIDEVMQDSLFAIRVTRDETETANPRQEYLDWAQTKLKSSQAKLSEWAAEMGPHFRKALATTAGTGIGIIIIELVGRIVLNMSLLSALIEKLTP
jgi:hypothetical protein